MQRAPTPNWVKAALIVGVIILLSIIGWANGCGNQGGGDSNPTTPVLEETTQAETSESITRDETVLVEDELPPTGGIR